MLVNLAVGFLGVIFFLFIFWKKLKEDYSSDIIFKSAFSIIIGIIIGWAIAVRVYPSVFLWFSVIGSLGGLLYANKQLKIKVFESMEAIIIAGLPWLSLVFLSYSVQYSNLITFVAFLLTLVFIFLYYFFNEHYKEFTWYKSGKIGFSGLAIILIISAVRLVVAIIRLPVLSFFSYANAGLAYEMWADLALMLISAGLIINLGRKKI